MLAEHKLRTGAVRLSAGLGPKTIPAMAILPRINVTMHRQRGLNQAAAVPLNMSSRSTSENPATIS